VCVVPLQEQGGRRLVFFVAGHTKAMFPVQIRRDT